MVRLDAGVPALGCRRWGAGVDSFEVRERLQPRHPFPRFWPSSQGHALPF
jgi:hypothetical protein